MREEIYLETFGYRLRVNGGLFHIAVPDEENLGGPEIEAEYAPHQLEAIMLGENGGSISIKAILLAIRNDVGIYLTDNLGNVIGQFNRAEPTTSVLVQKAQFQLIGSPDSLDFVKAWLGKKFRRKMDFFQKVARRRSGDAAQLLREACIILEGCNKGLQAVDTTRTGEAVKSIRGFEGSGARTYWGTLSQILPPAYRFRDRSRQPSRDLFNAAVNYSYAILYRKVENELLKAGINTYASFLHSMERGGKAMVWDFIEPYRIWVDELVYLLCNGKRITHAHVNTHEGGVWLNKKGKTIVARSFHALFAKNPNPINYRQETLAQSMRNDAKAFAQALLGFDQRKRRAA
ncbi:MAG: CRISPR-associated endonuclease Cas1 [Lewinellaceae bacterium]|nr:CRISPR-associated endonuclease Cas1 [Saprospiraceae bacterium]MCB9338556.1 CRISPR-associated endonuclease Cas1 [Lewinellaceae bacterium]